MTELFNRQSQKELRQSLRSEMPKAELLLWLEIRNKRLDGYKFRRQVGIGPYIVDFYCPSLRLVIEIDGDSHFEDGAEEKDKARQSFLEEKGIRVLRFTNTDVYQNIEQVMEGIRETIGRRPPLTPPS